MHALRIGITQAIYATGGILSAYTVIVQINLIDIEIVNAAFTPL